MSTAEIPLARSNPAERPWLITRAAGIAFSTCLRHWMFWLWVVFAGYLTLPAIDNPSPGTLWVWLFLMLYTGGLVPILFAEHLVWDRNQLVPNYRKVHIAAMAIAGVTLVGAITAWLGCLSQISIWPVSGAAVFAFALGGWTIGRRLVVVVFGTGLAMVILSVPGWLHRPLHWLETPVANFVLGLAGCLLLLRLMRWFWRLDEDSSGYESCRRVATHSRFVLRTPRRHSWAQPGVALGEGQAPLRWPRAIAARAQDWLLDAGVRYGRSLPGWLVLRWELAWPGIFSVASIGLLAVWLVMLPAALAAWSLGDRKPARAILGATALATGLLVLGVLILLPHLERRSMVGYESLRPVTRSGLLHQWGASVWWRMLVGGLLLAVLFWVMTVLEGNHPRPLLSLVWGFYFLAVLAVYSGLLVLLRTVGGEVLQGVTALVGSILYFFALAYWAAYLLESDSLPAAAATAMALAAASVVIFRIAYRRWLAKDLE